MNIFLMTIHALHEEIEMNSDKTNSEVQLAAI